MEELLKRLIALMHHSNTSVADGAYLATPDDDNDLPHYGYFEVRGNAGTVVVDPVNGDDTLTLTFEAGECSKFRVKRIYEDSTATDIVIYY